VARDTMMRPAPPPVRCDGCGSAEKCATTCPYSIPPSARVPLTVDERVRLLREQDRAAQSPPPPPLCCERVKEWFALSAIDRLALTYPKAGAPTDPSMHPATLIKCVTCVAEARSGCDDACPHCGMSADLCPPGARDDCAAYHSLPTHGDVMAMPGHVEAERREHPSEPPPVAPWPNGTDPCGNCGELDHVDNRCAS